MLRDAWLPKVELGQYCPSEAQLKRLRHLSSKYENHTEKLFQRIDTERRQRVAAFASEGWNYNWLMPYRGEIREAIARPKVATILLYLADCPRDMTPLGVWLLGKCADRFRLHNLRYFCGNPSPQVRKHVARALLRAEAWHLLSAIAVAFPLDFNVRRIAKNAVEPVTHRPFAERLDRFKKNVDHSHAAEATGPSRMPYWSLYNPWQGKPAKSAWLIRQILLRIRQWVRGV